jgi:hypothetical protein
LDEYLLKLVNLEDTTWQSGKRFPDEILLISSGRIGEWCKSELDRPITVNKIREHTLEGYRSG